MAVDIKTGIDDNSPVCRICLLYNEDESLEDIFIKNSRGFVAKEAIEELFLKKVVRGAKYPKLICTECVNKLMDLIKFRDLYLRSTAFLENIDTVLNGSSNMDTISKEAVWKDEDSFTLKLESDSENDSIEVVGLRAKNGFIGDKNDENCSATETFREQDLCNQLHEYIEDNPIKEHVSSTKGQRHVLMKNSKDGCRNKLNKNTSGRKSCKKDKIRTSSTNKEKSDCKKKSYICDICGKVSPTRQSMAYHVRVHSGARPHMCKFCNKSFYRPNSLKVHLNIHLGIKPFQCKICQKTFTQKSHLVDHERRHFGERKYPCDQCLRSFLTKGDLNKHQLMHEKERPFLCTECGKSFKVKYNLKVHMRIHSGLKTFKCNVCTASFYRNGDLKEHSVIHMKVKPFTCAICKRYFQRPYMLKNHNCNHKGESGYSCKRCSMKFSGMKNLRCHERFCKKRSRLI